MGYTGAILGYIGFHRGQIRTMEKEISNYDNGLFRDYRVRVLKDCFSSLVQDIVVSFTLGQLPD